MYAICAGELRDVCSIVDDEDRAAFTSQRHGGSGKLEERGAGKMLRANLQEARAAAQARAGEIDCRPASRISRICIDDDVERLESDAGQTASARRPPPGRDWKRSMNDVLRRPAWKSGSARIRRCIGIVVLMP